jgi:translocation and assembly module TamA
MWRGTAPCPLVPIVLLLLVLLCCAPPAVAQDAPRPPDVSAPPRYIAYVLTIDGPDPPAAALRSGLDLARWLSDEEMTLDLLERLARDALPQARDIAAVEGFYDAAIDITIDRDVSPIAVRVKVDPGTRARVGAVAIDVTGPATTDSPRGTDAVAGVRERFALKPGDAFRQADWIAAKDAAERAMRRSPYAAARIVASEARVDPARAIADLELTIASGPPFRIGRIAVQGTQRYPESLVENFSTLRRGEYYDENAIDAYVRRLAASGYFASVQASIDTASADPDDATVKVAVIEAPTHRVEGSISFSTDTRYGGRVAYTNVNLDDAGLQMRLDLRLEDKEQLAAAAFTRPPTAAGWLDKFTLGANRTDYQNSVQTTAGAGVERRGLDERNHSIWSATYYFDREEPQGADTLSTRALYLEAGYVLRRADSLLSPTRGYMIEARAGGGVPGASTEGFLRGTVKSIAWYPVDRATGLTFRAEVGGVFGAERTNIPSVLLFRTGGDTTVRGYEFESLGVPLGDAIVGGRYYALASAEVVRWINDLWGIAAFVDAGDAADAFGELDPAVGVGIGARLATPIGPFRLDVAYGEATGKWRIHFSVGLTF